MAEPSADTFALLRKEDSEFAPVAAAGLLAPLLGCVRAELQHQLADRPGILFTGLPRSVAAQAARLLAEAGTQVLLLPQTDLVTPPPLREIRHGKVLEEGFQFRDARGTELAPWNEIVFFDAAEVMASKQSLVKEEEPEYGDDGGLRYRSVVYRKLDTDWQEFLDIVCYEPWVHLRIDKEQFRYPESGLPLHPTTAKRFLALLIAFKTRCDAAAEGPGVKLHFDGRADTHQRIRSAKAYENLLQWRLTLRFREAKA